MITCVQQMTKWFLHEVIAMKACISRYDDISSNVICFLLKLCIRVIFRAILLEVWIPSFQSVMSMSEVAATITCRKDSKLYQWHCSPSKRQSQSLWEKKLGAVLCIITIIYQSLSMSWGRYFRKKLMWLFVIRTCMHFPPVFSCHDRNWHKTG